MTGQPPTDPDASAPGEALDLVDILLADHRAFQQYFTLIESSNDPGRRRDVLDVAIAELMRHAAAEEQYVYPAARRHLPDGNEIADHETDEHSQAEEVMSALMPLDPGDPDFDELVTRLIAEVRHHLDEEEEKLFPALRAVLDRDELVRLGTEVLAAKEVGPTRPHPAAPDSPPFNRVVGPLTGLIDRASDALSDRPTSPGDLR